MTSSPSRATSRAVATHYSLLTPRAPASARRCRPRENRRLRPGSPATARPDRSAPCRAPALAAPACDRRAARDCGTCRARRRSRRACRAGRRVCGSARAPPAGTRARRRRSRRPPTAPSCHAPRHPVSPRHRLLPGLAAGLLVARAHLRHLGLDLLAGEHLLLDQQVADRADPLLVIGGAVVLLLPVALDHAPVGVDRQHAPLVVSEQDQHRIGALLPQGQVVLGAVDGPEGEPADIVDGAPARTLARHVLPLWLAHCRRPPRRRHLASARRRMPEAAGGRNGAAAWLTARSRRSVPHAAA